MPPITKYQLPITRSSCLRVLVVLAAALPAYADTQAPSLPKDQLPAIDKILAAQPAYPKDSPFTQDVSAEPADPKSDAYVALIGGSKGLHPDFGTHYGIPFNIVDDKTQRSKVRFDYPDESDAGSVGGLSGYPIPDNVLIEPPTDSHILLIDKTTWMLYETWDSRKKPEGWMAGSGAIFDLKKNPSRPKGWTSADAAGLPIFPLLVRYDEVCVKKQIDHAIRFTINSTMRGYVAPATHMAPHATKPGSPPMGIRVRLKAGFDISPFPADAQVILTCMKKYGMILADNGSDWYISGAPDPRWNDDTLNTLKKVKGKDLEVIKLPPIITKNPPTPIN